MALKDWLGIGSQALNWWQLEDAYGKAGDSIDSSVQQGRQDVKQWQAPYAKTGLESLGQYVDRDPYKFNFDDYMNSEYVDYALDKGMDATLRTQAAKKGVGSGNTLAALSDYNRNEIGSQYGEEDARQYRNWEGENERLWKPAELGADVAMNVGDNLADLSMIGGASKASIYGSLANARSRILSSTAAGLGNDGDGPSLSGMVDDVMDVWDMVTGEGLGGSAAIKAVVSATGLPEDVVGGILSGTAGDLIGGGTGLAATGAGSQAALLAEQTGGFGAAGTELTRDALMSNPNLASAVSKQTLGSWAGSVAMGAGIMMASKLVIDSLRQDPAIGDTLKGLSKADDPFEYISNIEIKDFGGLIDRVEGLNSRDAGTLPIAKGMLYNSIIAGLDDPRQMKYHDNIDTIVNNMKTALYSGRHYRTKYTGNMPDMAAGLQKMFPKISDELGAMQDVSRRIISLEELQYTSDSTDTHTYQWQDAQLDELRVQQRQLRQQINSYISTRLATWELKRMGEVN